MGFAKYHEDNLEIYDERMYYRGANTLPNIRDNYSRLSYKKIQYRYYCPFCHVGFNEKDQLIHHILEFHGNSHEFVFLNNKRVSGGHQVVQQVYSLKLYSFRNQPREIKLRDNIGRSLSFWTKENTYEYDIQNIIHAKLYSEIYIENIDNPVYIKQQLDINRATIDKIISGRYVSNFFDEQVSDELLSPKQCLTYMKMLIHEGVSTAPLVERIDFMQVEEDRDIEELYLYYLLQTADQKVEESKIPEEIRTSLLEILNGKYSDARTTLETVNRQHRSNDKYGCYLIISLLKNDKTGATFFSQRYSPYGFIGILEKVLFHFYDYQNQQSDSITEELDDLSLFQQYPLVQAVLELNDACNHKGKISYDTYLLLKDLSPVTTICYSIGLDELAKEKVLRSSIKKHGDSALLKSYAFNNKYTWLDQRISVSDGDIYVDAIRRTNKTRKRPFSDGFIREFPFNDELKITPLGGAQSIGASCFVISYKGYHIMLDCGIDPTKSGNDAYPYLDSWNNDIDAIIVSHAHLDHSGGVPKAHAMWPNARIYVTAPTKVFLNYLYSDMARVRNGISEEFEIENVTIEKEVMQDTLSCMSTVTYGEWVEIGEDIRIRLLPAGHLVGAAMIEAQIDGKTILYTGDFSDFDQALSSGADFNCLPDNCDYLISEATYLGRKANWGRQKENLKQELLSAIKAGKSVLLPSAAIGRSQELVCIIGEMRLMRELPECIKLYIAGMAIPTTTQIIPFMNERYEKVVGMFNEIDTDIIPGQNSIVIASSASLSSGSASYKIKQYWDRQRINYEILASKYLDENRLSNRTAQDNRTIKQMPLSTHADIAGIYKLINKTKPKVLSFVHQGSNKNNELNSLIDGCLQLFSDDLLYGPLEENKTDNIFDMYAWMKREKQ